MISDGGRINTIIMFLRRNTKKKGGVDYDCWTLVESVRTARGPRQRVVATIGKLPGLDREERIGWDEIGRILSGKPRPHPGLFDQPEEPPSWATVNLSGVSVERLRHFGDAYLGLLLWTRLGFAEFCREEWRGEINASGTERQETWHLLPPEVQKKAAPYLRSAFS